MTLVTTTLMLILLYIMFWQPEGGNGGKRGTGW